MPTVIHAKCKQHYVFMERGLSRYPASLSDNETNVRTITSASYTNLQLHVFCDASIHAFCIVAYWCWYMHGVYIK